MRRALLCAALLLAGCGDHYVSGPYVTPDMVKEAARRCAANEGWSNIWEVHHFNSGPKFHIRCVNGAKFFSAEVVK